MPKFNVTVPHTLTQAEATERLNRFADILREKFKDSVSDLEQTWEGNALAFRFKTFGFPISGKVTVGDKESGRRRRPALHRDDVQRQDRVVDPRATRTVDDRRAS